MLVNINKVWEPNQLLCATNDKTCAQIYINKQFSRFHFIHKRPFGFDCDNSKQSVLHLQAKLMQMELHEDKSRSFTTLDVKLHAKIDYPPENN